MKSPFPGMDPYLEQYWGDVHASLATYAKDQLQKKLPKELVARIEERVAVESKDFDTELEREFEPQDYYPDVRIHERRKPGTVEPALGEPIAVVDAIEVPRKSEPFTQRSIRIIEPRSGNKIITAIELLGPANKLGKEGREAYEKKRSELLDAGVSLVEIDLIREGRPNLAVPISQVPAAYRGPYRICVVRTWRLDRAQMYRVTIRQPLPHVSIPLRKKDKEVSLELQPLIELVYENGRYDEIDYSEDPEPPLARPDAIWADRLLREKGLRK